MDARAVGIQKSAISPAAWLVLKILKNYGFEAYLVGGCVRDLLLKKPPKDFDVITTASLNEIRKQFNHCRIVGQRFPICHVMLQKSMIEVSSFSTIPKGIADRETFFPAQIPNGSDTRHFTRWKDSLRRDFTINSLFYDPLVNEVYDYVDGIQDIRTSKVRTVIPAHSSFEEDCARILRGFRIAARLNLQFTEETASAIRDLSTSIVTLGKGRLGMEMHAMLAYGAAERSLCLLQKFKLLELLLPLHAAYLEDQTRKGYTECSTMLMKLFSNVDKLLAADRPSNCTLWLALLAFHLALVYHPQDSRVVWTLCSILYHGTWRKASIFAAESLKDHVQFSPEISVCSSTKSAVSLLEDTSHFASLIQKSLKMLTSADEVFQCLVKRSDPIPCVGLVFVSPQVGIRLHKLFNVLATDIRSYDMERKTSTIDYNLLKNGGLSETRFVLGKVIMDTMEGEHALTREQNLETKAKKSSLHEHILNMATVDKSRPDKPAQQNNRNVSSAEKSQFLAIIDEWNKKVPAAQSHGNRGEKNQSFDAEKEINKPSGKKNQKMVVTKGHNHNGEHDRQNGAANKSSKLKRRSDKKPSAENKVCKISGEKNQMSVAKEKIDGKVSQNVRPLMKIPLKKLADEQNLKAITAEKRRPLSALFK